ncbi:MAG: biopolymer transporter ExbD, partial [Hoeflea sp.]|nr:biopolymer transporter ExbD [Hoeflea sp.]
MKRIAPMRTSRKPENTVPLINVVFLMLIFFLVAGTLAPAPDSDVDFITLPATDPASPPDMMVVRAHGTL